ncbi:MAG TPA: hypothetical protein VIT23_10900 [Terrimicrobiaceae bacterium]
MRVYYGFGISVILMSLVVLGCATTPTTSDYQWQLAKQRQQEAARNAGRIGYIGNAGGTAVGFSR